MKEEFISNIEYSSYFVTPTLLMSHHSLVHRTIPVPMRLRSINNLPHSLFLLIRKLHIPRSPVRLQTRSLRRTRNGNHALCSNPRKRNLTNRAALLCC